MNIGNLITHFSTQVEMPVKVNSVRDLILSAAVQDRIEFVGVEYDVSIIRGNLIQYIDRPGLYSDPILVSSIYYATNQEAHWQRLVCCKEMLHILDRDLWKAKTDAQVSKLISKMVLPPEILAVLYRVEDADIGEDGAPEKHSLRAALDWHTDLQAVAVLFPLAVRERLLPLYAAKRLTIDDIARYVDLPPKYIGVVMGTQWPGLHDLWTAD